jgi:hypothetical protein
MPPRSDPFEDPSLGVAASATRRARSPARDAASRARPPLELVPDAADRPELPARAEPLDRLDPVDRFEPVDRFAAVDRPELAERFAPVDRPEPADRAREDRLLEPALRLACVPLDAAAVRVWRWLAPELRDEPPAASLDLLELARLPPELRDEPLPDLLAPRDDDADARDPRPPLALLSAAFRLVCFEEFLVVATWSPFQE